MLREREASFVVDANHALSMKFSEEGLANPEVLADRSVPASMVELLRRGDEGLAAVIIQAFKLCFSP